MRKYIKCNKCGWRYGNIWHICRVWEPEVAQTVVQSGRTFYVSTQQREKMSISQQERWDRFREANKERDVKMLERYNEGDVSYDMLASEFGISRSTVVKVMKEAKAKGIHMPRKPGLRIGHTARS